MDFTEVNVNNNASTNNDNVQTDGCGLSLVMSSSREDTVTILSKKYDLFYSMRYKYRGQAVIFNHSNFTIASLEERSGTNKDKTNLEKSLKRLGFCVTCKDNLEANELLNEVERYAKMDHSEYDCFVMCILTHGDEGVLYAKDVAYTHEMVLSNFAGDKCKTLAGKPKIFFIQACQGKRLDGGMAIRSQVDSSSDYKIPVWADFLVAYSTIPGYYSWRDTSKGSWFIQSLCFVLDEFGYEYDLLSLLTLVNQKVAIEFTSYNPDDKKMDKQKQVPYIAFMLTRLIKFEPKERTASEAYATN